MSKSKKPRKAHNKHKLKFPDQHPLHIAVHGSSAITKTERIAITQPFDEAITALRQGEGTPASIASANTVLRFLKRTEQIGVITGMGQYIADCEDAIEAICVRAHDSTCGNPDSTSSHPSAHPWHHRPTRPSRSHGRCWCCDESQTQAVGQTNSHTAAFERLFFCPNMTPIYPNPRDPLFRAAKAIVKDREASSAQPAYETYRPTDHNHDNSRYTQGIRPIAMTGQKP